MWSRFLFITGKQKASCKAVLQPCFSLSFLAIFYYIRKRLAAAEEILKEKEVGIGEFRGGKPSEGQRTYGLSDQAGLLCNRVARSFLALEMKNTYPLLTGNSSFVSYLKRKKK